MGERAPEAPPGVDGRLDGRVDDLVGPHGRRQGPAHGREVGGDDRLDPGSGQRRDDGQADGTGSEHDRGLAGLDP